jgi:hypothetical protein
MTEPTEIQTQEEIEHKFETDRAFTEESVSQSLGRVAWLSTRLSAELALTLFDLGVQESIIPAILEAIDESHDDFLDFVRAGLGADEDIDPDEHPLENSIYELVDELKDTLDITNGVGFMDSHMFEGGNVQMMDYGEMSEEDILHKLTGHIKRLESNHPSE